MKRLLDSLHDLVDARQLAVFRMVYGAAMLYEVLDYLSIGLVERGLLAPKMLFKYEGFTWVQPFSAAGMNALLALLVLAAACITVGLAYRVACIVFTVGFTFVFLQDKALYNNHLYLFCLLGLLLACMPANRVWGLDRIFLLKRSPDPRVPRWTIWLLRAQFFIVYFYGGIAKLSPDWLGRHEPMRTVLQVFAAEHPWAGSITHPAVVLFYTYGGLLFDLLVGFLLLWRPSRTMAVLAVVFFNVSNHFLFNDIGVFPFVMLPATLLFFSPEEVAAYLDKRGWGVPAKRDRKQAAVELPLRTAHRDRVRLLLAAYMAFQLIFPLRWTVMPGDPDRTSVGQRFSWRMKSTTRGVDALRFFATNDAGERGEVDVSTYLNTMQVRTLPLDPRMMIQFAQFALKDMRKRGIPAQHVTSDIVVRYNGRAPQRVYPPDLDLAALRPGVDPPELWLPKLQEDGPPPVTTP